MLAKFNLCSLRLRGNVGICATATTEESAGSLDVGGPAQTSTIYLQSLQLWISTSPAMALTVLTNSEVTSVLDNLTRDQLHGFQAALSKALHEYTTNPRAVEDGIYHQPPRIHHSNPQTGATSLFMPSIGPAGIGIKGIEGPPYVRGRPWQWILSPY